MKKEHFLRNYFELTIEFYPKRIKRINMDMNINKFTKKQQFKNVTIIKNAK